MSEEIGEQDGEHFVNPAEVAVLLEAMHDPSAEVRVAMFEALTRLPLAPSDWMMVGAYAAWVFDVSDSPAERLAVIDRAPSIPLRSIRERIALLAQFGAGEEQVHAVRAAADFYDLEALLTEIRVKLRGRAVGRRGGEASTVVTARRLAMADVSEARDTVRECCRRTARASEVRFWLALALARAAADEELAAIFKELRGGKQYDYVDQYSETLRDVLTAEPWGRYHPAIESLRDVLAGRPLPKKTVRWLSQLAERAKRAPAKALAEALLEASAARRIAPFALSAEPPGFTSDPPTDVSEARVALRRLGLPKATTIGGWGLDDKDMGPVLERGLAPVAVTMLFERAADNGGVFEANHIVGWIQGVQDRFRPELEGLFRLYWRLASDVWERVREWGEPTAVFLYKLDGESFDRALCWQIGWTVSRGGLPGLVSGLAVHLTARDQTERIAAAFLIADAADYVMQADFPLFGGGFGPEGQMTSLVLADDMDSPAVWGGDQTGLSEARKSNQQMVEASQRVAYPRVDCPDAVIVEVPFDVVIGLAARPDRDLMTTGKIVLPPGDLDVDLLLTYDPVSLKVDGPLTHRVRVSGEDPYPFETVHVTALYGEDLAQERRLGVHFLVNNSVVGFAWRTIVVVDNEKDLVTARRAEAREYDLLELGPLAIEDAPDLLLAVYRSDDTRRSRFAWAAFPADPAVAVPDVKRSTDLGEEAAKFATNTRRTIQIGGTAEAVFDWLHGIAKEVGDAVPAGIVDVIRAVAEQPNRPDAATLLLLTEEIHVPWELAVFRPPVKTRFGGASPFLGAHVAIARWLLRERKPRPTPPRRVDVRTRAVVTAKYADVKRWPQLPAAEEEAAEIERAYPPTTVVPPLYEDVMKCLRGDPQADVMHFALHGQFDPDGVDEGLVLLAPKPEGGFGAQYLQAAQINSVEFAHSPFVFLNACQLGTTKEVLGDYAGIAAAFLGARAAGVVAPLWNVDDRVASSVARDFYQAAYSPDAPYLAELLRRERRKYTREAVLAEVPDSEGRRKIGPTLIAYQLFGHPRLRLVQVPPENGGEGG